MIVSRALLFYFTVVIGAIIGGTIFAVLLVNKRAEGELLPAANAPVKTIPPVCEVIATRYENSGQIHRCIDVEANVACYLNGSNGISCFHLPTH